MNILELAKRFENVQDRPDGFFCRCPAHKDKGPSLSVREKDGKILIHCFAGCSTADVIAAVGLRWGDLFSRPADKSRLPMALLKEISHAKTLLAIAKATPAPWHPEDVASVRKARALLRRYPEVAQ